MGVGLENLLKTGQLGKPAPGADYQAKTEQFAKDFESLFLHKLMEQMDKTVSKSGLLGDGISEQVRDIFWFYLAQEMADNGGVGLWRDIQKQQFGQSQQQPEAKPTLECEI